MADLLTPELPRLSIADALTSMDQLHDRLMDRARQLMDWYAMARSGKRTWARGLRIVSILCGSMATLVPMAISIAHGMVRDNSRLDALLPASSIFGLLAATSLLLDKFFGCSSSWMRYTVTHLELRTKAEAFHLAWQGERLKLAVAAQAAAQEDAGVASRALVVAEPGGLPGGLSVDVGGNGAGTPVGAVPGPGHAVTPGLSSGVLPGGMGLGNGGSLPLPGYGDPQTVVMEALRAAHALHLQFLENINGLERSETQEWVTEFKGTLADLEKRMEEQRSTAAAQALQARGAIRVTIEGVLQGRWDLQLGDGDAMVQESSVAVLTRVPAGIHTVKLRGTRPDGSAVALTEVVRVDPNQIADMKLRVTPS